MAPGNFSKPQAAFCATASMNMKQVSSCVHSCNMCYVCRVSTPLQIIGREFDRKCPACHVQHRPLGCPKKPYFPTVNTGQHPLTVESTHLRWVFIDRAHGCDHGAIVYICSFILGAAKSCRAALRLILGSGSPISQFEFPTGYIGF